MGAFIPAQFFSSGSQVCQCQEYKGKSGDLRNAYVQLLLYRDDLEKETGDLFMAWADVPWILEGAAVRVSLVAFDDGAETARALDGQPTAVINPDLTGSTDLGQAQVLEENARICFMGTTKVGSFDIPGDTARGWLDLPNPNGRSRL